MFPVPISLIPYTMPASVQQTALPLCGVVTLYMYYTHNDMAIKAACIWLQHIAIYYEYHFFVVW